MKIGTSFNLLLFLALIAASASGVKAGSYTASVSGNWSATATWGGSGPPVAGDTVTINPGVTVTVSAAAACATLTVSGTLAANNALTVSGATEFTGTGAYTCAGTSGTRTFTGDVTLDAGSSWTSASAGPCSFGGNFTNNATTFTGNGTYTFTGASKTLGGSTATALTAMSVSGSYANGGTVTVSGTLTLAGTLTNNGTLSFGGTSGSGTLTQGAAANLTLTQSNGSAPSFTLAATASGNTVTYSGSGSAIKTTAYYNLTLSGSGSANATWASITVSGTMTVGGTVTANNFSGTFGALTIGGGSPTANAAVTVTGNLIVSSGTFYAQSGLLTVGGTTTVNGGGLRLGNNAIFTGDYTLSSGTNNNSGNGTVGFAGNLTVSGGVFTSGTGVHTFSGTGKAITGTISISKVTVTGTCENDGALTVGTALAGSGTLTQGANSTLNVAATAANLTLTTLAASASPNTVNYNGAAQTVVAATYDNLTLSGGNTKTLASGGATVNSTLTIAASTTLADGGNTLIAKAGVVNGGTHSGAGKISLTGGSGSHPLSGTGAYANLELNDAYGASIASGTSTVNGTLILTSGALSSGGDALTLGNGASIVRAAGSLSSLTPTFGTSVNLTYNGTNPTTTGSELPAGATVLNNLIINNAAGVTLNAGASLKGTLTLTSGLLNTSGNQVSLASTGTISGAGSSSYVNGTLQKTFATGSSQSFTYAIGDGAAYAPINLAGLNVTTAGTLAATTTAGQHPQIATSGIDSSRDVQRYWSFTTGGLAVSTCNATFNFVAGDVIGGANTANFVVRHYSDGSWSTTTAGTLAGTSSQATGLSSFSDFAIGDQAVSSASFNVQPGDTVVESVITPAVQVTIADSLGAGVPDASVTLSAAQGTGLGGTLAQTTAGSGVATFADLSFSQVNTPAQLTAVSGSATTNSSTFNVKNGSSLVVSSSKNPSVYGDAVTFTATVTPSAAAGYVQFSVKGAAWGDPKPITNGIAGSDSISSLSSGNAIVMAEYAGDTNDFGSTNLLAGGQEVTAKSIAIASGITANDKVYDGTNTATISVDAIVLSDVVSGDDVTVSTNNYTAAFSSIGARTNIEVVVGGLTLAGASSNNYALTQPSGLTATITPAPLTVSGVTASDKVYDGATNALIDVTGATLAGVIDADTNDVTLVTNGAAGAFADANVEADKDVVVSGLTLNGNATTNYTLTQPTVTASITPASLTITADDQSRAYGLPNPALTASYNGFVNDEDTNALTSQAILSTTAETGSPAGTYPITVSGAAAANYTISYVDGILTIVPQLELGNMNWDGNQFVFAFPSQTGQTYQVEYNTNLTDSTWTPLGDSISGTGAQVSVTNSITAPQIFFRLHVLK
jgi:hypothetical protein